MQNDNKISISLNVAITIAVCIGAFIVGVICYFIFGNKTGEVQVNTEQSVLSTTPQNEVTTTKQENSSQNTNKNTNSKVSEDENDENASSSEKNIESSKETNESSKSNPLSVGEWGIASKYSSGSYVDVPVRVINVTRGSVATNEYKEFCNKKGSIYKYEEAEEGTEWTIVEYEVDLSDFTSDTSISIDRSIIGTGNTSSIKYNGNLYYTSTINMTTEYSHSKVEKAKFATQLPKGCTDYLIVLGNSSGTQAYISGK